MSPPVAIVVGYVIRYPVGGMTWVFANYLLGLRALGYEPVFMEAAGPQPCCYDVEQGRMTEDPGYGVAYWESALAALGLEGLRWWYRDDAGDRGMSREEAVATLEEAAILLNVGASGWAPEFARAPRRTLVDCDAPFTQFRLADEEEGWTAFVDAHDTHATYAVNLAEGRAAFPDGGRRWIATRPPVDLDAWPASPQPAGPWTTVTSWGAYGSAYWELEEYRQKDAEYVRLRDLPGRVPELRLELALGGDAPRRQLEALGWEVVDPVERTRTPVTYRDYLRFSRGELGVAKQAYVKARTGAFNDRSLNYLASGRPVVCSDTGLDWLPTGTGLLPFDDAAGAAEALRAVEAEPERHASAARQLAERHFAAPDVLRELLRAVDVTPP